METEQRKGDTKDHPDQLDLIQSAAIRGVRALGVRTILIRVIGLVSSVALARILTPDVFGLFAVCSFAVGVIGTLAQVGLATPLIQQNDEPTELQLQTVVSLQFLLLTAASLVLLALAFAGVLTSALTSKHVPLVASLCLSSLVSTLGTGPSVRLDRQMRFAERGDADLGQQFTYYLLAVWLAASGWGVHSLTIATLSGSIVAVLLLNLRSPFRPRFAVSLASVRGILAFGLPMMGQTLVGIWEAAIPIAVGPLHGATRLGYITWADNLSLMPYQFVYSIYGKILLPSLARLQHLPTSFADRLDRAAACIAFSSVPILVVVASLADWIVPQVFTEKWLPALPIIYLLFAWRVCGTISSPYYWALNAAGQPRSALRLRSLTVGLQTLVAAPAILLLGPVGYAAGMIPVGLITLICTALVVRRHLPIAPVRAVGVPVACSLAIIPLARMCAAHWAHTALGLLLTTLLSFAVYLALVWLSVRVGLATADPFKLLKEAALRNAAPSRAI